MKKKVSAIVAAILIFAMVIGMIPLSAFAEGSDSSGIDWKLPTKTDSEEKVRLLSIGDSTSNGYYLDGYNPSSMGMGSNCADHAYPKELYNDLVNIYGEDRVIFSQYCINTTRWNEFSYYLDNCFSSKRTTASNPDKSCQQTLGWTLGEFSQYANSGVKYLGDPSAYENVENTYSTDLAANSTNSQWFAAFKDSVENANIITIDLGMNAYGTYLSMRLVDDLKGKGNVDNPKYQNTLLDIKDDIIATFPNNADESALPNKTLASIRQIEAGVLNSVSSDYLTLVSAFNQAMEVQTGTNPNCQDLAGMFNCIDALPTATGQYIMNSLMDGLNAKNSMGWLLFDIIECYTYGYASSLLYYDHSLSTIYDANPDAMIIVNALYNGINGMEANFGEQTLKIGEITEIFVDKLNEFYAGKSAVAPNRYSDKIHYNDEIPSNLAIWVDAIADFSGNPLTDYHNEGFDVSTLNLMVDMLYRLNENSDLYYEDLSPQIGTTLLNGIEEELYSQILETLKNNETASSWLEDSQIESIASRGTEKVMDAIKANCLENGSYITANDIKKAYANNTQSEFAFDMNSLSIMDYISIAWWDDYSSMDSLFGSEGNANFVVASAFESIRLNMIKAANLKEVDLEDVFSALGTDVVTPIVKAFTDFDNASSGEQAMAHIAIRLLGAAGVGTHPSAKGTLVKYNTIKKQLPEMKLTIHYQYEDGTQAAEDYLGSPEKGKEYNINSPSIDGYVADHPQISGTMGDDAIEETVVYKAGENNLTIHYVDKDGNKVANDYTAQIAYGKEYSVDSPTVERYYPDQKTVSGKMEAVDIELTVTYAYNEFGYCDTEKEVSLSTGEHHLIYNGKDMGSYTFAGSKNTWTIKDQDGYLAVSNGKLVHQQNAFNWTYSNNAFSCKISSSSSRRSRTTTYYLAESNGTLTVKTSRAKCTFKDMSSGQQAHVPAATVKENVVAATCHSHETYDEVIYCSLCNAELQRIKKEGTDYAAHTPGTATIENIEGTDYLVTRCTKCQEILQREGVPVDDFTVNVTVSKKQSTFFFFFTRTTYQADINVSSVSGQTPKKVEVSTNNSRWSTGTSYTSSSNITKLYVRVTDQNGTVTTYFYQNGTTKKI